MNKVIERISRITATVADRRYMMNCGRKLRKDSILGGLPVEQRAKVDKWLFDKGLTYQQVSEACAEMFGVKVSRSSVGRYYQARSKVQSPKSKAGNGGVSEKVGEWASETEQRGTADEQYQWLIARVMELAWFEANLPDELRDVKHFCRLMRLLIAARRERNQAVLAAVARAKFELWVAGQMLKHAGASMEAKSPAFSRTRPRG